MVVVIDVGQLQFKFDQNRTRLRGVNTFFWSLVPTKRHFLDLLGTIIGQIMTIYIKLEQTWLTIKKLCDLQVLGGVEELEARNYLSKKEKS